MNFELMRNSRERFQIQIVRAKTDRNAIKNIHMIFFCDSSFIFMLKHSSYNFSYNTKLILVRYALLFFRWSTEPHWSWTWSGDCTDCESKMNSCMKKFVFFLLQQNLEKIKDNRLSYCAAIKEYTNAFPKWETKIPNDFDICFPAICRRF